MGIHDLLPYLRKHSPTAFKPFQEWKNNKILKVAIDTPIFMYKFAYGVGNGTELCDRMVRFAEELRALQIEPIFVFDGSELPEKDAERKRRKTLIENQRKNDGFVSLSCSDGLLELEVEGYEHRSFYPTASNYESFRSCCENLGIQTKRAKYEAEALCAHICETKEADAMMTEDSDALAYGCKNVILRWGEKAEIVDFYEVLNVLQLDLKQFQIFCVLLGNDFNDRIKGLGPVNAMKLVRTQNSIETLMSFLGVEDKIASIMIRSGKIFECFCGEKNDV